MNETAATVTFTPTAEWLALPRQEQLYSEYSDYYKDVHGIRPRWAGHYSEAELEDAIKRLEAESAEAFARQDAEDKLRRELEGDYGPYCRLVEVSIETYPTSGEGWTLTEAV